MVAKNKQLSYTALQLQGYGYNAAINHPAKIPSRYAPKPSPVRFTQPELEDQDYPTEVAAKHPALEQAGEQQPSDTALRRGIYLADQALSHAISGTGTVLTPEEHGQIISARAEGDMSKATR